MQGSKRPLAVTVAVAAMSGGCIVHNHPPTPSPQSAEPQQVAPQSQQAVPKSQPRAQAVPTAKPAPVTRPAAPVVPAAPQQPAPPQPAAPAGRTYTIKPGDNLWNISKEVYGDGTKYQRILDANPGINPDNMKPGTKIIIP